MDAPLIRFDFLMICIFKCGFTLRDNNVIFARFLR